MYILNKPKQEWLEPKHPDIVARELMRDLISIIQGSISKHFFSWSFKSFIKVVKTNIFIKISV